MCVSRALACAVVAAVAVATGCSSDSGESKAGNESRAKPVELVLANHEGGSENVGAWAEAVERLSEGSIRIRVSNNWRQGESNYEEAILNEVRRGDVPLASVMSRALDVAGVTSFQPLAAPLLIDSAELQRRVLKSELAGQALAGTEKIGMVGLALMPGDLRRPVGLTRALTGPEDYRGARVYTREGKVAAATLNAFGAQPAHGPTENWFEGVDGAEVDLSAVRSETQLAREEVRITSNVVLWAQPVAIVMNEDAFDELSDEQQRALREASAEAFDERNREVSEHPGRGASDCLRHGHEARRGHPGAARRARGGGRAGLSDDREGSRQRRGPREHPRAEGGRGARERRLRGVAEPPSEEKTKEAALEGTFRTKLTEDELAQSPLLYEAGEVNDENWGELTMRSQTAEFAIARRTAGQATRSRAPTRPTATSSSCGSTISARRGASAGRCTAER